MNEQIVTVNQDNFEAFLSAFKSGGKENLFVLADFDKTLTKPVVAGREVPSLISILRDEGFLSENYAQEAHELYDHYTTLEKNPQIPYEEKKKAMEEWWRKHFALLIKEGLKRNDILRAVQSPSLELRDGAKEFLEFLRDNNIPVVIISSSGLGVEAITMLLQRYHSLFANIHVICNEYVWDNEGAALSVKEPIIHSYNKDATNLALFPFYNLVQERRNVILLGDSLEDVGMAKGLDNVQVLKIGFLSVKDQNNLDKITLYKKKYDVLDFSDEALFEVIKIVKTVILV